MSQRTLAKRLALVKPELLLVGIDLASAKNVAVVLTTQAQQVARFSFPHTRAGYDFLYRRIATLLTTHARSGALIGMEPTNYYWKLLAADLEARRPAYAYRLVNPYTLKKHREGDQLARAKDDQRDAFAVADLLRTGKFTETQLLHGGYAALRQYATLYTRQQRDSDQARNLLHAALGPVFPELGQVFKDITGMTAQALLRQHAAAAYIRQLPFPAFIAGVRANFSGSRLALSKLRRVHRLAGQSVGLSDGWAAYQLAVGMHLATLQQLRRQQSSVAEVLVDTLLALPEAPYLLSMPCFGPRSAALLLAEIGDPSHFSNARQLVKLAGTQPVPNISGRQTHSRTPMSHKGRSRLRTLLFWASLRLIQHDAYFQQLYARLQTRTTHPLSKMAAVGVVLNKVLHIAWALMRQHPFYDPQYSSPA